MAYDTDAEEREIDSDGYFLEDEEELDEGEEEEEDLDSPSNIRHLFDSILRDSRNYSFDRPDDFIELENTYRGRFDKVNSTYGTLLHFFVSTHNPQPPILLAKWIIRRWPGLLKEQDSEHKTPIHLALEPKTQRFDFVELVLDDCPDTILATALAMEDNGGRNCLHHAIYERFRSTLKLIKKCNPDTFLAREKHGQKTPLLIAMDLDTAVAKRKPLSSRPGPNVASKTRPDAGRPRGDGDGDRKQGRILQSQSKKKEAKPDPKEVSAKGMNTSAKIEDISRSSKMPSRDTSQAKRLVVGGQKRIETDRANNGPAAPGERFSRPDVVQCLIEHSPTSLSVTNTDGQTPYQYRLKLLSKSVSSRFQGDLRSQDPVARGIKEYCLRVLGREEAIDALYKKGKGTASPKNR